MSTNIPNTTIRLFAIRISLQGVIIHGEKYVFPPTSKVSKILAELLQKAETYTKKRERRIVEQKAKEKGSGNRKGKIFK